MLIANVTGIADIGSLNRHACDWVTLQAANKWETELQYDQFVKREHWHIKNQTNKIKIE
jgi:hypothetical protein